MCSFIIQRFFLDAFFGRPQVCFLCGGVLAFGDEMGKGVCRLCFLELKGQMSSVCQICGIPVKAPLTLCNTCRKNLYYFDSQRSLGVYQGNLKSTIIRFKHWGERWLAEPLGGLMAEAAREFGEIHLVVPVPIDPKRKWDRGFNQAEDLSKVVSSILGKKHLDLLTRDSTLLQQKGLGRQRRWENLRGAIRAKRPCDLRGARILVVDDVVTTGATLDETARVLKNLGAEKVFGVSCARTIKW